MLFPPPLGPTSATTSPAFTSSESDGIDEAVGRAGIAEADAVENDALAEAGELDGVRLLDNGFGVVEVLEDFVRGADGLLEDVVDADKALDGLEQHDEREDEAGEVLGGERAGFDLLARVGQQADDGERRRPAR